MFTKILLFMAMPSLYIQSAWSIHCYDCNSRNNSMCVDPSLYDTETLMRFLPPSKCGHGVVSADPNNFFCRKIVQTILHKGYEPEVRVTRGCAWVRHHKDCYKADNEDHLETVCQCFSDGCNAAAARTLSIAVAASVAALGFKMHLYS